MKMFKKRGIYFHGSDVFSKTHVMRAHIPYASRELSEKHIDLGSYISPYVGKSFARVVSQSPS